MGSCTQAAQSQVQPQNGQGKLQPRSQGPLERGWANYSRSERLEIVLVVPHPHKLLTKDELHVVVLCQ